MSALLPVAVRVVQLHDGHRAELQALCDADPIVNAVVSARLADVASLDSRQFGGPLLGAFDRADRLTGAVFAGGNLIPVGGGPAQWHALATALSTGPRLCSSLVGPAESIAVFWQVLEQRWGPCRALRGAQPLLVLTAADKPTTWDRRVRRIEPHELDAYLPAAAAMFTEELDVAPHRFGGEAAYRRRVAALITAGRALGIVEPDGQVIFKADLGVVSERGCQVQGVWVHPDRRGHGLGTAAFAAVLRHALTVAPAVSLYVNDYNVAARRMYARLGMRQVATFTTVLL